MKTNEKSAENLAFDFCKVPVLEILKNSDRTKTIFENFNVPENLMDIWYNELINDEILLTTESKTKTIEIILKSSHSMIEFCCKIIMLYGFREKIISCTNSAEERIINEFMKFFKNI
jgi:hypothetical protein